MFNIRGWKRALGRERGPFLFEFWRHLESDPLAAQSYQTLLSSLKLIDMQRPLKSLLITSAQPGEGKSTVTVGLGLMMLSNGADVLLVDGDTRRPSLDRLTELSASPGLVDVLKGTASLNDAVRTVELPEVNGSSPTLKVLTSGPPGTGLEPTWATALADTLTSLARGKHIVLVDSPPTLAVNDALFWARLVDGVVLVLNTGTVAEQEACRARERLEQAGGTILGVAMNRFDSKRHGPGLHPYQSYYTRREKS